LIARMNAASQAMVVGESNQESAEHFALFNVEASEQRLLMLARHPTDFLESFFTLLREVEGIEAAVAGIGSALDETAFFEVIENRHEATGVDAELGGKLLLAEAGRHTEETQNAGVRRGKVQNLQSFRELRRGIGSELGKEKCRFSLFHPVMLHLVNNYCIYYSFSI